MDNNPFGGRFSRLQEPRPPRIAPAVSKVRQYAGTPFSSSGRYKHNAVLPFGNVQLQARRSNCTEGALTAAHIGRTEDEMQAVSVEIEIHENLPPIARAWNANCSGDSEQNSKDVPLAKNTLTGVGMRRIGARVLMAAVEAVAFRMSAGVNR